MQAMQSRSSQAQWGIRLVTVGIGLRLLLLAYIATMFSLFGMGERFEATATTGDWIGNGVLLVVLIVSTVLCVLALRQARQGAYEKAWIKALVASLLPPIDFILLAAVTLFIKAGEASRPETAAPTST